MRKETEFTRKVINYIKKHPVQTPADIALKFNLSVSRIYQLRKKAQAEAIEYAQDTDYFDSVWGVSLKDIPDHPAEIETAKTIEKASQTSWKTAVSNAIIASKVDTILDQRATQYGKFIEGAEIMQTLKQVVRSAVQKRGTALAFDQLESIDMMIHKLGRIINGNPDNVDSWRDIAGYATLVADRLEGNVR